MAPKVEQCKSCMNPVWLELGTKIAKKMDRPSSWKDLMAWAKKVDVSEMQLRNVLAWLGLQGIAKFQDGAWLRVGKVPTESCPKCNGFARGTTCLLCGVSLEAPPESPRAFQL